MNREASRVRQQYESRLPKPVHIMDDFSSLEREIKKGFYHLAAFVKGSDHARESLQKLEQGLNPSADASIDLNINNKAQLYGRTTETQSVSENQVAVLVDSPFMEETPHMDRGRLFGSNYKVCFNMDVLRIKPCISS